MRMHQHILSWKCGVSTYIAHDVGFWTACLQVIQVQGRYGTATYQLKELENDFVALSALLLHGRLYQELGG